MAGQQERRERFAAQIRRRGDAVREEDGAEHEYRVDRSVVDVEDAQDDRERVGPRDDPEDDRGEEDRERGAVRSGDRGDRLSNADGGEDEQDQPDREDEADCSGRHADLLGGHT